MPINYNNLNIKELNNLSQQNQAAKNTNQTSAENMHGSNVQRSQLVDKFVYQIDPDNHKRPVTLPKTVPENYKDINKLYTLENSYRDAYNDEKALYQSNFFKNRYKRNGLDQKNIDRMVASMGNDYATGIEHGYFDQQTSQDITNSEKSNGPTNNAFRAVNLRKPTTVNGKTYKPGVYFNADAAKNDNYATWLHELSHYVDRFLLEDAKAWNHSLIEGNLNPKLKPEYLKYFGSDTEIRARAVPILLEYIQNKDKYKNFEDFIRQNEKTNKSIRELLVTFKDYNSFENYMNNFAQNDNNQQDPNGSLMAKMGTKLIFRENKLIKR